jgi:hypothetical protein
MKRLATVWSVGSAVALVMSTGACGSMAGNPVESTAAPAVTGLPAVAAMTSATLVPAPEELVKFEGMVTLVRVPEVVVDSARMYVTAETAILGTDLKPVGFNSLRPGQGVEGQAWKQADGLLRVIYIHILTPSDTTPTNDLPTTKPTRR